MYLQLKRTASPLAFSFHLAGPSAVSSHTHLDDSALLHHCLSLLSKSHKRALRGKSYPASATRGLAHRLTHKQALGIFTSRFSVLQPPPKFRHPSRSTTFNEPSAGNYLTLSRYVLPLPLPFGAYQFLSFLFSFSSAIEKEASYAKLTFDLVAAATAKMGALKYVEELQKKKQSDLVRFLLRVRCWEVRCHHHSE